MKERAEWRILFIQLAQQLHCWAESFWRSCTPPNAPMELGRVGVQLPQKDSVLESNSKAS